MAEEHARPGRGRKDDATDREPESAGKQRKTPSQKRP